MPTSYARPELLASPDWLAEHLGRPGIRVIDCRYRVDGSGRQLHAVGHIPGAVFVDWAHDLVDTDDELPYQLVGPDAFAAVLSRAGIGDGMTAVLYDDAASHYAARMWWSLQVYGFQSVRILDGGWTAWQASGRPVSSASGEPEPATFTPRASPRWQLSTGDVRALLGSREVDVIDVRAPAEFHGQGGNALRLGHIPGAINVPAALLTEPGSQRFVPADRAARVFAEAGAARARRAITYDGSGIAATKSAFVLDLLGYADIAVYAAGWADWGSRMDLPVDR
ncbi:MAG TPA: sulfurtransferase [Candidatus Limnocylindrales bacterium]|nr:sulfurtransferase [Candidatus Limnocylindrales bacterium]